MTTTDARPDLAGAPLRAPAAPARSAAAESLLARLDDPRTAGALHDLLDHAELLALAALMADGLLKRGETITGNLADGLADLRRELTAGAPQDDLRDLAASLRDALPALRALLASDLVRPATVTGLATITGALGEGLDEARRSPSSTLGVRGLLAQLRDPATLRGLGMLLAVARALGRRSRA